MSEPSPLGAEIDLLSYAIVVNGTPLDGTYQVLAIEVEKGVFRIPRAKVTIRDGNASAETFPLSESSTFVPGSTTIDIQVGYGDIKKSIFSGEVWGQRIRSGGNGTTVLILDCRDQAAKATVRRQFQGFANQTDATVIKSVLGTYNLEVNITARDSAPYPSLVQWDTTDWDFSVIRAQANGWIVVTDGGVVTMKTLVWGTSPVMAVTFGRDILGFDLNLDSLTQIPSATAESWDSATQTVATGVKISSNDNPDGSDNTNQLANSVVRSTLMSKSAADLNADELTAYTGAAALYSEAAKIRGKVSFQGSSLVNPGDFIQVSGLGARFDGNGFVGGVNHDIRPGKWTTEVRLGLEPDWFAALPDVSGPPAMGLLPPMRGLQIGVVTAISADPEQYFRVHIQEPMLSAGGTDGDLLWARLATFYASKGCGDVFYPEIGDEVVVGFLEQDPRSPIILGSLYSKTRPPPTSFAPTDDKNNLKAIVTRSQLQLSFDDGNKIIKIATPAGNIISLSEQGKSITLTDQTGNTITMSSEGISMKSKSSVTISAATDVNISATGNVTIKGETVKSSASTQASLTGVVVAITGSQMVSINGA